MPDVYPPLVQVVADHTTIPLLMPRIEKLIKDAFEERYWKKPDGIIVEVRVMDRTERK